MRTTAKSRKARPARRAKPAAAPSSPVQRVGEAVAAIRRGAPVFVKGDANFTMLAAETASDAELAKLGRDPLLLLTHARARTLKIRPYTRDVAALGVAHGTSAQMLRAIADPTGDLDYPLKGPFETLRETLPASYAPAVKLAKLAGLLPAAIVGRKARPAKGVVQIAAADIASYDDAVVKTLTLVTRARVPLEGARDAELAAFRAADGGPEHYAVIIGTPATPGPVLTRLHSECFTGDLLGSLKCDCGSQLRGAIDVIAKHGSGVLLYLAQEGRGIGLINKLRAYRLQDQGFDTIEANERLGFEADERLYGIAAKMLTMLGYRSVRLLTNNPAKVAGLEAAGIEVVARVAHSFPDNDHNRAYMKTKAEKAGHLL